jgi:hypothetical protein
MHLHLVHQNNIQEFVYRQYNLIYDTSQPLVYWIHEQINQQKMFFS